MSEQTPEPAPEADGTAEAESFDADRAQAKIRKANDEARSLRQRLKELEPLAQEAERQREASKTAEQRAAEQVTAAEQRAVVAERALLRLQVVLDKRLDPDLAEFVSGESREDMEAAADKLLSKLAPAQPQPQAPQSRRPVEQLRPGASPAGPQLRPDASPGERIRAGLAQYLT